MLNSAKCHLPGQVMDSIIIQQEEHEEEQACLDMGICPRCFSKLSVHFDEFGVAQNCSDHFCSFSIFDGR